MGNFPTGTLQEADIITNAVSPARHFSDRTSRFAPELRLERTDWIFFQSVTPRISTISD